MKFVLPGGSGQVGGILVRALQSAGHEVVVLSRSAKGDAVRTVAWDGAMLGPWTREINGADVVINLAGRSINCRYHARNRRQMIDSRVLSTRAVGQAIAQAKAPPRVWLQASTATIYAHRYDAANDEATGIMGGSEPNATDTWRFSIEVAKAWEAATNEIATPGTRKVLLRSAMTMSPDYGGVFDVLLRLVRFGLGGQQGDGQQFVSWIHEHDFVRAIEWLIAHDEIEGAVNLAAPNPLPNAQFMRSLRDAWGAKFGLPATQMMLEVGAFALRSETELILKSRRVVPRRLMEAGFEFAYSTWPKAAAELCHRWRKWHTYRRTDLQVRPSISQQPGTDLEVRPTTAQHCESVR